MKRVFALILLLCHMNTSMFLPQVDEDDQYDAHGQQLDDINTVAEYIDQVVLGNVDKTPEDEDSDNGQNFHLVKNTEYHYEQAYISIQQVPFEEIKVNEFALFHLIPVSSPTLEIVAPPPDTFLPA